MTRFEQKNTRNIRQEVNRAVLVSIGLEPSQHTVRTLVRAVIRAVLVLELLATCDVFKYPLTAIRPEEALNQTNAVRTNHITTRVASSIIVIERRNTVIDITNLPVITDVHIIERTFGGWYDNENLTGSPVTEIAKEASGDLSFWAKWRIVLTDPDGAIVSGSDAFAKLTPVTVPTLVLPDGQTLGGSVMLKYVKVDATSENTVIYEVYLVDQDGNRVKLPAACTLCLPYPEGLSQSSASTYRIHILHEMDGGRSEDFDSVSGGLELTEQGLCVRISSLSPFTITWERFPEISLPQTGDSSRSGLWLALGLISAAALAAILLRGRKRTE